LDQPPHSGAALSTDSPNSLSGPIIAELVFAARIVDSSAGVGMQ
jgi:hypothetical protein